MRVASTIALVLLLLALPIPAPAQERPLPSNFPSGEWTLGLISRGDTTWGRATLQFAGDSVRGHTNIPQENTLRGTLRGDSIEIIQYWDSTATRARYRGVLLGGTLAGTVSILVRREDQNPVVAAWVAMPQAVRSGPPRSISFEPQAFYRVFSGAIRPALHIFPGDTIHTKTIDAAGTDWNGEKRDNGGNPQTGPFYVEGALPGDVIAVHLHRVRVNRDYAVSSAGIVPGALTPGLARGLSDVPGFDSRWFLDRERGVARLMNPTPALSSYEVPLRPMVGTVGVAPAQKQAVRTQDSGPFGGNLDYNELREGATVYLTVNEPGALLFIGDGHAVQGDGELTGDALETSLDVDFSVDVIRGRTIGGPRAENAEYLMSIGIAGDLHEALRLATADMIRWIALEYRLNSAELAAVVGTAMRYDVAEIVGSQFSIVARIPRSVLAGLRTPPTP